MSLCLPLHLMLDPLACHPCSLPPHCRRAVRVCGHDGGVRRCGPQAAALHGPHEGACCGTIKKITLTSWAGWLTRARYSRLQGHAVRQAGVLRGAGLLAATCGAVTVCIGPTACLGVGRCREAAADSLDVCIRPWLTCSQVAALPGAGVGGGLRLPGVPGGERTPNGQHPRR